MRGDGIQNSNLSVVSVGQQNPPNFPLTLFLHKPSEEVILAEGKNDFVEFLITFLGLPYVQPPSGTSVHNLASRLSDLNLSQSQVRYGRPGEKFLINDNLKFKPSNLEALVEFSAHLDLPEVTRMKVNFGLNEAVKLANNIGKPKVLSAVFHHLFYV